MRMRILTLLLACLVIPVVLSGTAKAESVSYGQAVTSLSARPAVSTFVFAATQVHPPDPSYTVRSGDTLSSIAKHFYGNSAEWPALWYVNRHTIPNPNDIRVGERLTISSWHPQQAWLLREAEKAIPAPPVVTVSYQTQTYSAPAQPQQSYYSSSSGSWPGGAFGNCVVQRESGGNSQVMNATGHYGLYQFSYSTWVAYGGSGADFGHASVGEQEQVFMNAMAAGGEGNWSAYDGC